MEDGQRLSYPGESLWLPLRSPRCLDVEETRLTRQASGFGDTEKLVGMSKGVCYYVGQKCFTEIVFVVLGA